MKKVIYIFLILVCTFCIALGVYKLSNKYNLNVVYSELEWSIYRKGIEGAKSFDIDGEGNLYVAFSNKIMVLNKEDSEYTLLTQSDFNIYDIVCYKDSLIIATGNKIIKHDLKLGESEDIITDLPNKGLNKEVKLALLKERLYVSIGTNTNSGIVENAKNSPDIPSFQWVLTGENYGEVNTGAFSNYGVTSKKGQSIEEGKISNGSIIWVDLKTKNVETYATGIRNVKGIDFNSDGDLMAIVGGIEDYGVRPIKDDRDYIYEIKEKAWYGWPDYSGGDPVTSPRFLDESTKINFVLENHPAKALYGPKYQHNSIASLSGLAVDKDGKLLMKNTIIFADNKEKSLYAMDQNGRVKKISSFERGSEIKKIISSNKKIYILDTKVGCIYELYKKDTGVINRLPTTITIFIFMFIISVILSILYKVSKIINKK